METTNHKRTIVFDLDGSLETPYFDKSKSQKVKEWMTKHQVGNSFDKMYVEVMQDKLPHFFLNGAFELLQWVHAHGFEIVFFSNAVEERNRELCPILMERAFSGLEIPPYRILSRGRGGDSFPLAFARRYGIFMIFLRFFLLFCLTFGKKRVKYADTEPRGISSVG